MKMKINNERRTRFEIINYCLNVLKGRKNIGIPKTRFLQKTNLSPYGFKEYYNLLIESKLIKEEKSVCKTGSFRIKIFITKFGEQYLKKSNSILLKINNLNKVHSLEPNKIKYPH